MYTDKDGLKKVSKVPDYDYPVFDKPYYEEHPNGDIKHVRLPCVDDETQGTSSFFTIKLKLLALRIDGEVSYGNSIVAQTEWSEFHGALKRKQIDTQLLLLAMMAAQALIDAMQFMILKILIRALFLPKR